MRWYRWLEIGIVCACTIGAQAGCRTVQRPPLQDITVTRTADGVCMGVDDYDRLLENLTDMMLTIEQCEAKK